MEPTKIHWKKALELLTKNEKVIQEEIEFDEKIQIHSVIVFNKNGIDVPEHLIDYDDDAIDCSDIAEITQEDIASGKLVRVLPAHIKIDSETQNWITKSNINYNELLATLLKNFYQSIKTLPNKAAF